MTNAAAARRAPPSDADEIGTLTRYFRNPFPLLSSTLRFLGLSRNAVDVFEALYSLWWGMARPRAWPLQTWLMLKTRLSESALRRALRELEAAGIVVTFRVPLEHGGYRNEYEPGPEVLRGLRELARRSRARTTSSTSVVKCGLVASTGQGERVQPVRPTDLKVPSEDLKSMGLTRAGEPESLPPSSVAPAPNGDPVPKVPESSPPPPPAPALVVLSDARLARLCLLHLAHLANPNASPREPSGGALALATARLAELGELSDEEKLRRGKLAVESAHRRSLRKSGKAPSPGYVFGTQSYFVGHLERAEREAARAALPPVASSERDTSAEATVTPQQALLPALLPQDPAGAVAVPAVPFERDTRTDAPPSPAPEVLEEPGEAEPSELVEASERFAERRREVEERARAAETRRLEAERQRARARLEAFALAGELAEGVAASPPRPVEAEELARVRAELLAALTPDERAALERRGVRLE